MIDQAALDGFVQALTEAKGRYMAARFPSLRKPTFTVTKGRKFAKVVEDDRSVFCFIDLATGDLLKSASYNVPAKGARGHISNGAREVTPYGCTYNNGMNYETLGGMGFA